MVGMRPVLDNAGRRSAKLKMAAVRACLFGHDFHRRSNRRTLPRARGLAEKAGTGW